MNLLNIKERKNDRKRNHNMSGQELWIQHLMNVEILEVYTKERHLELFKRMLQRSHEPYEIKENGLQSACNKH